MRFVVLEFFSRSVFTRIETLSYFFSVVCLFGWDVYSLSCLRDMKYFNGLSRINFYMY